MRVNYREKVSLVCHSSSATAMKTSGTSKQMCERRHAPSFLIPRMATTTTARGRGRGRGGLGKYLRARGRRGGGRPAEFGKRLRLEDEESDDDDDENDEQHVDDKYAKRQLVTNADRYEEPEVDPHGK